MAKIEGEPTHSRIFRNGENGALQARRFGGVADDSVFDTDLQIYRPRNESDRAKGNGTIQPTGGVVGEVGGSTFNGKEYVPTENLKS